MRGLTLTAAASAFMMLDTVDANFLFSDFRPRSYKYGMDMSI